MGNKTPNKNKLGREFSSGGVVFKKEGDNILWLIRKTSVSDLFPKAYWMLPKGWVDDAGDGIPGPIALGEKRADENLLQNTALREVKEETGVNAKIIDKIGTTRYFYTHPQEGKILKFVTFYLMEWQKDLPEGFDEETSEIAWLPYDEAFKTLSFSREKDALKKAKGILATLL